MLRQEVADIHVKKYSKALEELITSYHERPAEEFKKLASEIIEDFDSTLFDHYGYLPSILKQELLNQYKYYQSK